MTLEGIEFINARPEVVIDWLACRRVWQLQASPSSLFIKNDGRYLKLHITGKSSKEYPIRRSFLHKLLRWYSFPVGQLTRLSADTAASVCNDFLVNIKREYVNISFEGEETLTITSPDYSPITDLEIIKKLSSFGLSTISRNDFIMRVTTKEKYKFEAVKGDDCGLGISVINSETGFHSLNISHFLLRYICSNGAMIKIPIAPNDTSNQGSSEITNQRNNDFKGRIHYGYKPGELNNFLNLQVNFAATMRAQIAASVEKMTKNNIAGNKILDKIRPLLERNEKLPDEMTQYELFNLVTERSKKYGLSGRIYWEQVAGEMISN